MASDTYDDFDDRADLATADETIRRLKAKIEAALAKSAAYPVTCPSCGYGWRAGLTSMARTLRGGDDAER